MDINNRHYLNNKQGNIVYYENLYPLYLYVTDNIEEALSTFNFYRTLKDLKDGNIASTQPKINFDNTLGYTMLVSLKDGSGLGVLILINSKKETVLETAAHESTHYTDAIFDYIGAYAQSFDESNEPYAYLLGWCYACISDFLNYRKEKSKKINKTCKKKKKEEKTISQIKN